MVTRQPGKAPAPASAQKAQPSWGFKGAAAITQQADIEKDIREKQMAQSQQRRFWVKKGDECQLIILDNTIDDLLALYEYEFTPIGGTFKDKYQEISPKSWNEECPLEGQMIGTSDKPAKPYYVTFATVLVLQPYTNSKGEEVKYTRKLLPIKGTQIPEFMRLFRSAQTQSGRLRGFQFRVIREDDDKAPRIGRPNTLENLQYGFWTDKDLEAEFGHPAIKSEKDNKVIVQANGLLMPYDYYKLFKPSTSEQLIKTYRIGAVMGSRQEENEVWDKAVDADMGGEPAALKPPAGGFSSEDLLTEDDIPF